MNFKEQDIFYSFQKLQSLVTSAGVSLDIKHFCFPPNVKFISSGNNLDQAVLCIPDASYLRDCTRDIRAPDKCGYKDNSEIIFLIS